MSALNEMKTTLPTDKIDPDPQQPRRKIEGLKALSETIKAVGIIQPIVVRPHPTQSGRWMIVVGERRWRAAVMANLATVPVYDRGDIPNAQIFFIQIIENLDEYRQSLEAHEKAIALTNWVSEVGVDQACQQLGQKKDWISRETALAKVPDEIWDLAEKEKIQDKRTILDLHRLCQHTKKAPAEEWKGIDQIGPGKRQSLHARMEASGAKKKRQPKDVENGAHDDPGQVSAGTEVAQPIQITPRPKSDMSVPTPASFPDPAAPGRFQRKGLYSRLTKAGKVLGIDADHDFEALLEELLRRAVPEAIDEKEPALA